MADHDIKTIFNNIAVSERLAGCVAEKEIDPKLLNTGTYFRVVNCQLFCRVDWQCPLSVPRVGGLRVTCYLPKGQEPVPQSDLD